MLRSLAIRISAAATSRTWVTPPGTPSTSLALIVCTESTTSSVGLTSSTWPSTAPEVGLGREVELVLDRAGAVGAHPHLRGRLLAGDVEDSVPLPGRLRGHLEQQRGLADAGLTGQQDRRARDHAAAEHPVELGDPAGARQRVLDRHLTDRQRRGGDRTGLHPAPRRRTSPRPCPRPGTRRSGPTHLAVSQPHSLQW